jgi:hypothetical protein
MNLGLHILGSKATVVRMLMEVLMSWVKRRVVVAVVLSRSLPFSYVNCRSVNRERSRWWGSRHWWNEFG